MFLKHNSFLAFMLLILHFIPFSQAYSVERSNINDCGNDCERKYYNDDENTKYMDLTHAFNNYTAAWPGRKITFYTEWERRDSNGIW